MLATAQIVSSAEIIIDDKTFSSIGSGCLLFVCIEESDSFEKVKEMTNKIINFRMLDGPKGISSKSLKDSNEEVLIVSQFTLAANLKSGNRPDFRGAMEPKQAKLLFDHLVQLMKNKNIDTKTGIFGSNMKLNICNDGPVTLPLDIQ